MAGPADERQLYDLLVEMWRHNGKGWGWEFDPTLVMAKIEEGTRPDPSQRSNPSDKARGIIGLIDGPHGPIGTIGIYLDSAMWFSREVIPVELWFYIRPSERCREHSEALRDFALWVRDRLKPAGSPYPFPLATGFIHADRHFPGMMRVWRRLWPGARQIGALFWID